MSFVITGFGKFMGVEKNPTSELLPALVAKLKDEVRIVDSSVLEVSALEALRFVGKHVGENECVFVHLGVAATRTIVSLEQCAFNEADFRGPDERGWCPAKLPIVPDAPAMLESDIPRQIIGPLKARFGDKIEVSSDAGRFLCNYIFFSSLQRKRKSIFVHVPPFEAIPFDVQLEMLVEIIREIKKIV